MCVVRVACHYYLANHASLSHSSLVCEPSPCHQDTVKQNFCLQNMAHHVFSDFSNKPAPSQSHLDVIIEDKLVSAATKRKKFQEEMSAQLLYIQHYHSYGCSVNAPA